MSTPIDPSAATPPSRDDVEAATHAAPPVHEPPPPPDAGEPMGAKDSGRPSMLGTSFRLTLVAGMLAGLILALLCQATFTQLWVSRDANGWTWFLTGVGGIAVGGALTLFLYGVSTDRTDTGPKRRGAADVSTEGEERRSQRRRRRNARELDGREAS
jgi:hypothetical protein